MHHTAIDQSDIVIIRLYIPAATITVNIILKVKALGERG